MPSLGRQWRSWQDLLADEDLLARAAEEFPALADALRHPTDRRRVLQLMAAALMIGPLSGCDVAAPEGKLVPAVSNPPGLMPGEPNFYTTLHLHDGYASGIVVTHQMGRPVKVEGNPGHPASLGATDVFGQAQLLEFYDPGRDTQILRQRRPSDWAALRTALAALRAQLAETHGDGVRILTGTVTSPTLGRQLDELLQHYPQARWHQWQAISRDAVLAGAQLAYGRPCESVPCLDACDVLLSIDSDLLSSAPGHLRFARDWAARRNPVRTTLMSRCYAIECTPTLTGIAADHRFVVNARELPQIVWGLGQLLLTGHSPQPLPPWATAMVADLRTHAGRALVHIGPHQPAALHALVHAMNEHLGARDRTLRLIDPVAQAPVAQHTSLSELISDMHDGRVQALLILDSNPAYGAPTSLEWQSAIERVAFSLALTATADETSERCGWSVPMTHPWEHWSDARAFDGTAGIVQPQAAPLFGGTSAHTLLGLLIDDAPASAQSQVATTWQHQDGWQEDAGHTALAQGFIAGSERVPLTVKLQPAVAELAPPATAVARLCVLVRPDPHVWDGRYANNAWLQELPRPLTKLTWDNPLLISPSLAQQSELRNGDRVEVAVGGRAVQAPVWIQPGQADDVIVALTGFGRRQVGPVGLHAGVDVNALAGVEGQVVLRKLTGTVLLATTEHHQMLLSGADDPVRHMRLAAFRQNPRLLGDSKPAPELYRHRPPGPAAWGMSIDLNTCIGCNACVVACQAENNIPVVGKEQVLREREMHWLRIDRYWEGDAHTPEAYFQPMLCMHCEQAPCEPVCPVGATVHDAEGLNVMVYNRCVGTRFCSNNCPYKVRRFNYYGFAQTEARAPESRNPDVSVRARGVMEKCSFCVQRIDRARLTADRDQVPMPPFQSACQAACPTRAITFGNLADAGCAVVERKSSPLDYALLPEQNTHPRVTYEARIRNDDPQIGGEGLSS